MHKPKNVSALELLVIIALVFNFFLIGYNLYKYMSEPDIGSDKAVYVGLIAASSFVVGLLFMYAIFSSNLIAADVYTDKLIEEVEKLNKKLAECAKECPCAAEVYLYLFFAAVYANGIRRSIRV